MGFMDKVGNAANVAKWKADQQARIFKKQGEIRDVENRIYSQKANLAEVVLALFNNHQIENEELKNQCNQIVQLQTQIQNIKQEIDFIKNEQPPVSVTVDTPKETAKSGLVCPVCGEQLVGKFCPAHGVEGIPPANSSGLVCPVCGMVIEGKFCPKDGAEGVPYQAQ